MKAQTQKAGRTPLSPQSHNTARLAVDVPADHWLLKLPPAERNEAANRAFQVCLATGWSGWKAMQPFEVADGRVTVIPVPVVADLKVKLQALSDDWGVSVNAVLGCLAETYLSSVDRQDESADSDGFRDAVEYRQLIADTIAGGKLPG